MKLTEKEYEYFKAELEAESGTSTGSTLYHHKEHLRMVAFHGEGTKRTATALRMIREIHIAENKLEDSKRITS